MTDKCDHSWTTVAWRCERCGKIESKIPEEVGTLDPVKAAALQLSAHLAGDIVANAKRVEVYLREKSDA